MKSEFTVLALFLILISQGCNKKTPDIQGISGYTQGTTYSIVFDNNKRMAPAKLREKIETLFREFDMSLSLYIDSSLISKVNRNENVKVDKYFREAFDKSLFINKLTEGAFDITVGPLVEAWGFGAHEQKPAGGIDIDSLLNFVGMNKVRLSDDFVIKDVAGIRLDMNALAQGYSVDVVCDYLRSLGFRNFLVEIGGEVRAEGKKGEELWRIGIDRPEDNNMNPGEDLQAVIRISGRSLATSGNYRKFYVENGIKYSHTINPKTGYPARNTLLSATILAADCATADGIATACMVMGKDDSIDFLGRHPELSAFLVFSDEAGNFITWHSANLEGFLSEQL